jgi:hypothetical protein
MYIIDDVCYANERKDDISVKSAKLLRDGMILVEFATGEKRLFDTSILEGSAFLPLKDEKILRDITIFHGVMTWNDGEIDIAPEMVYEQSYPYNELEEVII